MGVLDEMTRGITDRKATAAGKKLTPVGLEASPTKPSMAGLPDVPGVFLTNEAVADIARDLRARAATLIEVADGLDQLTQQASTPAETAETKRAATKAAEKKADQTFAEKFKQQQAEAQAAVFTSSDDEPKEEPEAPADPASGWECPDHGSKFVKSTTSRQGRTYSLCDEPSCEHYER